MNPDQTIFRPRYPLTTRVLIYGLPATFFTLLFLAGSSRLISSIYLWSAIFLLGVGTSLVPFFVIREIRFMQEMIIRRRFLPDQFISRSEFTGVSGNSIMAGGKRIRIGWLENRDELSTAARQWFDGSEMQMTTTKPQPPKTDYPIQGFGPYASFWGLIFGMMSIFVLPNILTVDPRWVLGSTFVCVYLIYIYVIPRLI